MSERILTDQTNQKHHAGDWLREWLERTGLRRDSFLAQLATMTDITIDLPSFEQWLAPSHRRSIPKDNPDLHLALIRFFYHKQVLILEEVRDYLRLCSFPGHLYPEVGAIFVDETLLNPYQRDLVMRYFFVEDVDKKIQDRENDLIHKLEDMYPAYVMDQYWFVRAMNRHILAILEFQEEDLKCWESWHVVAMKFKPELKVRERRGPQAKKYYQLTIKQFREDTLILSNTPRFKKLFQQLNQSEEFRKIWWEAKDSPDYDPIARIITHPETHLSNGTIIRAAVHISEAKNNSGISLFLHHWAPNKASFSDYLKIQELAEKQYSKPYYQITDYIDAKVLEAVGGI